MIPPEKITTALVDCEAERLNSAVKSNVQWVEKYGYEKHSILNDCGVKLVAHLVKPKKASNIYVMGLHGYRGNGKRLGGMTRHYIEKGYNVFLPDYIASGESEGKYCMLGIQEAKDCLKWLGYMTETFGEDIKIVLHGVSLGAAVAMFLSGNNNLPDNVKLAVEDSGFTCLTDLFENKLEKYKVKSKLPIKLLNFANKRKPGVDFYDVNPIKSVRKSRIPIMFIHGQNDGLVPSFMVNELYEACSVKEKELLIIEDANHAQSLMVGGDKYFTALDGFVEKYI